MQHPHTAADSHQKLGAMVGREGVYYRVWAPDHERITVRIRRGDVRSSTLQLEPEGDGYFGMIDPKGVDGDLYQFELPDGRRLPDPASRFQPEGVHGPSECIDPSKYRWRNAGWKRPAWRGQVIYELHVGTFTPEGTFRSAIERLKHIKQLGAEAIQIMPVADFAGGRNWGYDGVCSYAPARCYGRPDDLRALVDAAHGEGLAVILDVVYNHVGPDGSVLDQFARATFHADKSNPWGRSFNLDGDGSQPVRHFFVGNAAYWLDEFRIDGLRLDATHAIEDASARHLLADIADAVHTRGGFVIAEDERNAVELVCGSNGEGHRIDAVWADDFHHEVRVAVTGIQESYFSAYRGDAEAIAATLHNGWTYIGQDFPFWKGRARGSPCRHLPSQAFVYCIENHDQVGNRALGERLEHLIPPEQFRAASMLLCLSPYAPLLFMGQEWAASTPFQFFTDHAGEVGANVSVGRRREFEQTGLNGGIRFEDVPDPQSAETFERSKLQWEELSRAEHAATFALYQACLQERATWLGPRATGRDHWQVQAFGDIIALRYNPSGGRCRLLLVSLKGAGEIAGGGTVLNPPKGLQWRIALHTEEVRFGGDGRVELFGSWPTSEDVGTAGCDAALRVVFPRAGAALLVAEAKSCP